MIAALQTFWAPIGFTETVPEPQPRKTTPVFIGDAVQPWGRDTLLLEIIRRDEARRGDQP
jgi:hypothetical protein